MPSSPPPKSLVKREPFAYHARMAKRVAKFPEVFAVRLPEGTLARLEAVRPKGMPVAAFRREVVVHALTGLQIIAVDRAAFEMPRSALAKMRKP